MKEGKKKRIAKGLFIQHVLNDLTSVVKHNKKSIERIAASYGIVDKTEVKEYTELAIVYKARSIASSNLSVREKYWQIVDLYQNQVNLSHRTSQSILLQQYSTPAPIAFLAGIFVNAEQGISVFEPSAGNGLLTIAAHPSNVIVNEVDDVRRSNLEDQGYKKVLKQDATEPFKGFERKFDAVITNPPFGTLATPVKYETFGIITLDHLMALRALDCMKDDGKAAIIIGGHTRWDRKGRIQFGKNRVFFNYLFSRYHVADMINIDGHKLYSRQGTAFDVRLILINGRKQKPSGAAPVRNAKLDEVIDSFEGLFKRVIAVTEERSTSLTDVELEAEGRKLKAALQNFRAQQSADDNVSDLGMPYTPASESCVVLNTVVPDSMGYETHAALQRVKQAIGGDIDEFVRTKLNYKTKTDLCKALSAEQIDAVAMSIYNTEERGVGMIIGDQTGIGKGRIAASIIRYAVEHGLKPVFVTEKANLFSDIYRDLAAIGSAHYNPFIVNAREGKTDIKDEDGKVIYQALPLENQNRIFNEKRVPPYFHFVVATYSQFNSPEKKPVKPEFFAAIAEGNIVIMDEAHNSSGSGNTGNFMQSALDKTMGVVFLSATFAKRPDNMPIYAMKTSIQDATMSHDELIQAINQGGVALQEIVASQLVAEGQMIRRERSYEGVEVNYITLDEKAEEHKAIADNVTSILRDIIRFQATYVKKEVEVLDDIAVAEGKEVEIREGTSKAGVDNLPYFSKVFNVINQMLFSIKAESVAEIAIARLKEGKKPVIAFSSTMGSFIEQMENHVGLSVSDGDVINADFSVVLQRGLEGVLRYTVTDVDGNKDFRIFDLSQFSLQARDDYNNIIDRIRQASTGITISPIDVIIKKIEEAGYTVAEVTGRKFRLQLNDIKKDQELGRAGEQADFKRGDAVVQSSTGNKGTIEFILKKGAFIPGRDNTKSYAYEYQVKFDEGFTDTIEEEDLKHFSEPGSMQRAALVLSRKRENTNDAFRRFNNNEVDVLLINQAGSTGASAHAIVTPKVPKEKVKPRVMIVLQAELDISTEVQKRGRVNRTGQIFLPIYDYVISAIPAEKRLMMMLQKKLKSLDANTTSNQKSSTKILDVPDFLNKYGDKIVKEYLKEKPEINKLLDDPLHLLGKSENSDEDEEEEAEDSSKEENTEYKRKEHSEQAAHKVSGRVAVLSTEMQQEFYNEISNRYNEYVEYLKQIGEYDLEVEAMDLKAETVASRPLIVGKGGDSEFGNDSILETVNANVLKKPFNKSELNALINESLQSRDPKEIQKQIIADCEKHLDTELEAELQETESYYRKLIAELPESSWLKNIRSKKGVDAYQDALDEERKYLEENLKSSLERVAKWNTNLKGYFDQIFNALYVGKNLNYPVFTFESGKQLIPATFLGFVIDKRKKNPYRPSSVKLRFAIASSHKYMVLPASYQEEIHSILGASSGLSELSKNELLANWEDAIKEFTVDRKKRFIITGNVLQAFSSYKGKLVSYTTLDVSIKKGILMPDYWMPNSKGQQEITKVPIIRALKIIRSLIIGQSITTSNNVSLIRQSGKYHIIVPASKAKGGEVYLDPDILMLVEKNNFEKTSDKMKALLDETKIDKLITILQEKFNDSVDLTDGQYKLIKESIPKKVVHQRPVMVIQPKENEDDDTELLKLKAKALILKLKLLNFAA